MTIATSHALEMEVRCMSVYIVVNDSLIILFSNDNNGNELNYNDNNDNNHNNNDNSNNLIMIIISFIAVTHSLTMLSIA